MIISILTCGDRDNVTGVTPLVAVPAGQHDAVLSLAGQSVQHQGPPAGEEGLQPGGGVPAGWPVTQVTLTHTAFQFKH